MATLTPSMIALVATSVICQVIGASLMPMTKGLTEILPTLGFGIAFAIGLGIMARLINSGINLSALLPFMAAVVPLCAIAVGVLVYGESASALKISLLVFSCLTIGFASSMSYSTQVSRTVEVRRPLLSNSFFSTPWLVPRKNKSLRFN